MSHDGRHASSIGASSGARIRHLPRWHVLIIGCLGMAVASGSLQPCVGQPFFPYYDIWSWHHQTNHFFIQQQGSVPPLEDGYIDRWLGPGTAILQSLNVRADLGEFRLWTNLRAGSTNPNGAAYMDWVGASQGFDDFVFTCDDGRPSLTAHMNLRIKGTSYVSVSPVSTPSNDWIGATTLEVGGLAPAGFATTSLWAPHTWNEPGAPPELHVSTGMFAGIDADALDGIFAGPDFTVSTNVPQTIKVEVTLKPQASQRLSGTITAALYFYEESRGERIGFPVESPVFDLPSGCTCNSVKAAILNNCWPASNCASTSTSRQSWGGLKTIYR